MTEINKRVLREFALSEKELLEMSKDAHITKSRYVSFLVRLGEQLGVAFYAIRCGTGLYNTMVYNSRTKKVVCSDHEYDKRTAKDALARDVVSAYNRTA